MTIVIYSKKTCGYCKRAKDFLLSKNIPYTEFVLSEHDVDYIKSRDYYFNKFNCNTFPMITVGNIFIGGFSDLVHKYNTLELYNVCKENGLIIDNENF